MILWKRSKFILSKLNEILFYDQMWYVALNQRVKFIMYLKYAILGTYQKGISLNLRSRPNLCAVLP